MEQSLIAFAAANHIPLTEYEPLSRHTTFHIGGPARYFAMPQTAEQTAVLLDHARETGLRYAVIGNGSNLLVPDEGYDGLVIRTPEGEPRWSGREVAVPAGYSLARLSAQAAERGLGGLTFAQGIPGTVGGAVVMNAGAYGGEIRDTLVGSLYHGPDGVRRLSAEEHDFSYRHSSYSDHPERTVLEAVFCLVPADRTQLAAEMADYALRRREKQPLEYPSAGSTFKRPAGHFAGKLIEDAGLKGFSVGGAQVSEKHAGFVINRGGATCADVLALMEQVQKTVYERFGVMLEPEVKLLR